MKTKEMQHVLEHGHVLIYVELSNFQNPVKKKAKLQTAPVLDIYLKVSLLFVAWLETA